MVEGQILGLSLKTDSLGFLMFLSFLRTKDRSVACGRYGVPARMRLRPSLVKQTCGVNILDNPKPVEIIKK